MFPILKQHRRWAFALGGISLTLIVIGGVFLYLRERELERLSSDLLHAETGGGAYTDLNGKSVSLREYLGQPVFIVSWASWSPQCADLLPRLGRISTEAGMVPIVAINRMETRNVVGDYLSYLGEPQGIRFLLDSTDAYFVAEAVTAMPLLSLYDEKGALYLSWEGDVSDADIRMGIQSLRDRQGI